MKMSERNKCINCEGIVIRDLLPTDKTPARIICDTCLKKRGRVKALFKAKFKVYSVTDFGNGNVQVVMNADTNQKSDYAKYTPSGKIEFMCTNPEVNKQLAPGKTFEITFSESE